VTSAAPLLPRFAFTRHAVDRYRARVDPSLDDRAALHALRDASTRAHLCERRTRFGQAIWAVERPALRLITKQDAGVAVVVTVLDGADGGEDDAENEVIEAHKRIAAIAPEIATETKPRPRPGCCAGHDAAWLDVEVKRLDVERRRIAAVAAIEKNRAKERGKLEGVRLEKQRQAEARAAKQEARRENVQMHTARDVDKQVRYRNGLLRFAAAKLRTVDAEGSAELIAMIDDVLRAEQRKDERRISDSEKLT
jgi:hypothetical protein